MERQLKFRCWDTQYNKWTSCGAYACWEDDRPTCGVVAAADHELIIEQFTGLKDKNGKDIYEGDQVSLWYEELFFKDTVKGEIEWQDSCAQFIIMFPNNGVSIPLAAIDLDFSNIEVIGNIHQSQGFLK